jgi:hypothetical protein
VYHYATVELVKPYVRGIFSNALDLHPLESVWIDHAWKPGTEPAAGGRGACATLWPSRGTMRSTTGSRLRSAPLAGASLLARRRAPRLSAMAAGARP